MTNLRIFTSFNIEDAYNRLYISKFAYSMMTKTYSNETN
jgi:hypothetical protein